MADAAETTEGTENTEEGTPQVAEWASGIEDEGIKGVAGKFESQDDFLKAVGYEAPAPKEPGDWREGLSEDLRKTADRFASQEDAIRAIENFRKRESQVRVPGKDATDEERAAYYKAVGVPESADGYEFPEHPEMTEEIEASQKAWGDRFHDLNIPKDTAKRLTEMLSEDVRTQLAAQVEADKDFAKSQEDALKSEWKGDQYQTNVTLANRAVTEIANRSGVDLDALKNVETKDGRFLLDRADVLKMFAAVGREMAEGTLGPAITDGERETLDEQIRDIRRQQAAAQQEGDSKRANALYQREQALLAKISGNKPVVGVGGRVA